MGSEYGIPSMSATNPAALFEELGSSMEKQVTSLGNAGYCVTLRREDEDLKGLVAGQFSVWREVTGSRLFRATLHFDGELVEVRLDVRIGLPVDDAPVRRYRASETDDVWQPLSDDRDAGPFTSQALTTAWGQELRELLGSLPRPRPVAHLNTIVTTEE